MGARPKRLMRILCQLPRNVRGRGLTIHAQEMTSKFDMNGHIGRRFRVANPDIIITVASSEAKGLFPNDISQRQFGILILLNLHSRPPSNRGMKRQKTKRRSGKNITSSNGMNYYHYRYSAQRHPNNGRHSVAFSIHSSTKSQALQRHLNNGRHWPFQFMINSQERSFDLRLESRSSFVCLHGD